MDAFPPFFIRFCMCPFLCFCFVSCGLSCMVFPVSLFFCFGVDVEGLFFAFFVRVSPLSELGHVESKSLASGVF